MNLFIIFQRDQMVEAQEMFRTSNKVTRPEKALILGFMAGSRGEWSVPFLCPRYFEWGGVHLE